MAVVIGAPDHPALVIHAGAGRTDEQHVAASGASLGADVLRIVAGIAGLLHEDGDLLLRRDLVQDVVEQACEDPVAAIALGYPEPAFRETEATGELHQCRVGGDDLVERRIGPGDREGLGLGRRPVAAHLRTRRTALRLRVRGGDADHGDRNGA